jgi:hypothetical protein
VVKIFQEVIMKNFVDTIMDYLRKNLKSDIPSLLKSYPTLKPDSLYKIAREDRKDPRLSTIGPIMDYYGAKVVFPGETIRDFVRVLQIRNSMAQAADQANSAAEYIGSKTQRDSDVMFSPRILEDLDIDPSSAALYVVKDDETMNPVISKGDQVIVDLSKTQIEDGSLYLIHKDGGFWIRRIFREFRNIKLVTESKYLQPITLSPDDLSLVGKVVWIGHRL